VVRNEAQSIRQPVLRQWKRHLAQPQEYSSLELAPCFDVNLFFWCIGLNIHHFRYADHQRNHQIIIAFFEVS
jgi:hypothetical protein